MKINQGQSLLAYAAEQASFFLPLSYTIYQHSNSLSYHAVAAI